MTVDIKGKEISVLSEVLKEYLTELRTEILDTEEGSYRKNLEEKEKTLRGILADLDRDQRTGIRTESR